MAQPQTFLGERGKTQIKEVRFSELYEVLREKLNYYHPDRCDPDAFCQDVCCRVEKLMGIYPNVPGLRSTDG